MKQEPLQRTAAKVWLVGASQGIGLALCKRLLHSNFQVVASSRSATTSEELKALVAQYPQSLVLLDYDVSTPDARETCLAAWQAFQGIDLWFYNVGSYQPMKVAEWNLAAFEEMNQSNYLGAVKLMLALQDIQQQKQMPMRWIWNISLSADFGLPYAGGYSAPKAALLNLAESLHSELQSTGIDLQVINHGFVKTRLTAKNTFAMPGLMQADTAAEKIFQFINKRTKRFELRFPFVLSTVLAMLKRLPKQVSLALSKRML